MKNAGFCVIRHDNRYLLVLEKIPNEYGLWGLPGGKSDSGETTEQAAIREAIEEINVNIIILHRLTSSQGKGTRRQTFLATITDQVPQATDDLLGLMWFRIGEIEKLYSNGHLRGKWVYDAIKEAEVTRMAINGLA